MKALLVSILILLAFYFSPSHSSAHFTDEGQDTTVRLHIIPDDSPIANDQSTIILTFLKSENNFSIQSCECSLSIYQQDKKIFTQILSSNEIEYVFHKKDVYTLELIGKPLNEIDFQPFNLKWDIRVDQDKNDIVTKNTDYSESGPYSTASGVNILGNADSSLDEYEQKTNNPNSLIIFAILLSAGVSGLLFYRKK